MIIIHHRRNSVAELQQTKPEYGVEIDLRNHGKELIVFHDPFNDAAVNFEEWLASYHHHFMIANVKEEGLEPKLLELFEKYGVKDYFILDESLPFIRKFALQGLPNFAVRVSEFESIETALRLQDYLKKEDKRVDWIWVDSFTGEPLAHDALLRLRDAGFKLCQVSPELHHVDRPDCWQPKIEAFLDKLDKLEAGGFRPDMVCTKMPELWL
ncbi:hypothetical protein [Martelella sp. HB161492]|uniref:hypothetical protein n=1 Tax=Martelella sp. HB161492 TaxID=2720726 RepID=UPI0015921871|nr:hypothetical protein [Martelella sp. HB161492]